MSYNALFPSYVSEIWRAYFAMSSGDRRGIALDSLVVNEGIELKIGIVGLVKRTAALFGLDVLEGVIGLPLDGTIALDGSGVLGGSGAFYDVYLKTNTPMLYSLGKQAYKEVLKVCPARTNLVKILHAGFPLDGSAKADGSYTLGEINAFS